MELLDITLLAIAISAALYGYIQYGRQIPTGQLKPRPFTWLIWGVLGACVSIIQLKNGADLGAVGALLGAASGFVLAGMAWYYGKRKIYPADIISLTLASAVFLAWGVVGDAATAVMATVVYMIGFIPTVIRAWKAPDHERMTPFATSVIKYGISLILLGTVSLETVVYPLVLALTNFSFIIMLMVRRRR